MQIVKSIYKASSHFADLFFVIVNSILIASLLFLINVSCLQSVIRMKMERLTLLRVVLRSVAGLSPRVETPAGAKGRKRGGRVGRVPLDAFAVVSYGHDQVQLLGVGVVYDFIQFDNIWMVKLFHYFNFLVNVV